MCWSAVGLVLLQAVGSKGSLHWLVLAEHGGLLVLGLIGGMVSALLVVALSLTAPVKDCR